MVRKIVVTLNQKTIADLDQWISEGKYPNRSLALQSAVNLLFKDDKQTRLARELSHLDPAEEKRLAERGIGSEPCLKW